MKKRHHQIIYDMIFILLLIILFVALYTYILQRNYSEATVNAAVEWDIQCSDEIHRLVSDNFTRDDFDTIISVDDMQSERYQKLQQQLNVLRSLNRTRYLYTAKRNSEGKLIYLIDGLELGAEDFAYPGTYIEEEMIPYIEAALSGDVIYSQSIIDTTWGHIFTACYPVTASDGTGDILGALCIEIDMESTYSYIEDSNRKAVGTAVIAVVVIFVLGILISVYLRRQKEAEQSQHKVLEEALHAADTANLAKSTFLFNMSHDIRTPMNAILGFAELAENNLNCAEKTRDYLGKINVCGKKMLAILDNVLELSRIESGKAALEETAIEAGSVLNACTIMIQPEVDKKSQHLTVTKNIIQPYVYLDTTRVTEIILNLVSNAIKYTGEGGNIQCDISQEKSDKDGWVTQIITVSDNGIGMSEEFQKHIYESFSRERSSTESGIEGTGLGMGIVKKLVDMMDGSIELHSVLGKGSTFSVRIPCRIASKEDTRPKRAEKTDDVERLAGKHILLAEDNDLNAEIAVELLSEVGLVVDRAKDGVKCIEMLEKAPDNYYSVILMDIQMPILDGYDATTKIRKQQNRAKASIPIIAMTANAFAEDRKKALEVGMNDHVSKPIDMEKLIPTMLQYIR